MSTWLRGALLEVLQMEKLYFAMLGALLGVAGTIGTWHLQRKYRRNEINRSLRVEFRELQFQLGCASWLARSHSDTLTREFLDWFNPIQKSYQGPHRSEEVDKAASVFDNLDDERLKVVSAMARKKQLELDGGRRRSELLKKLELPVLASSMESLSLLPAEYQRIALDIRAQVSRHNEDADDVKKDHERTFDTSLSAENYDIVQQNLHESYVRIGRRAYELAKLVGEFLSKYEHGF